MEMKSIFKTMMMAVCCLSAVMFTSCGDDNDGNSGLKFSVAKVDVASGDSVNVTIGNGTQPFTVMATDEKTAIVKVNKNIMTVTGVKEGKASIIVADKNKLSGTLAVNVITPLSFDKKNVNVAVGNESEIAIQSGKAPYTVSVNDAKIATATVKDAKVTIKGVKAGTTTVSVLDANKLAGTITVTVQ